MGIYNYKYVNFQVRAKRGTIYNLKKSVDSITMTIERQQELLNSSSELSSQQKNKRMIWCASVLWKKCFIIKHTLIGEKDSSLKNQTFNNCITYIIYKHMQFIHNLNNLLFGVHKLFKYKIVQ